MPSDGANAELSTVAATSGGPVVSDPPTQAPSERVSATASDGTSRRERRIGVRARDASRRTGLHGPGARSAPRRINALAFAAALRTAATSSERVGGASDRGLGRDAGEDLAIDRSRQRDVVGR